MKEINLKNDCVFKYVFGMDSDDSYFLRKYIISRFLGIAVNDYTVGNSELNLVHKRDKKILKDILLLNNDVKIGVEMEYKKGWNTYNQKRFQYYSCRNISIGLMNGEKDYNKLKEFHELIFVDAKNKKTGELIERYTICTARGNTIESCLIHMTVIFLKEIDDHIKDKETISEEEALLYLLEHNTTDKITYEDKEGVISIVEKRKKQFERNEELMDYYLTEHELEMLRRMEIEEERNEAKSEGKNEGRIEGKIEGRLETILELVEYKYQKRPSWIKECTKEQIDCLKRMILQDISYEELKKTVLSL